MTDESRKAAKSMRINLMWLEGRDPCTKDGEGIPGRWCTSQVTNRIFSVTAPNPPSQDADPLSHPSIGKYIRCMRVKDGLSGREVARKAGISHVELGRIERDQYVPSLYDQRVLCSVIPSLRFESLEEGREGWRKKKLDK